jgi:hypothetical protein
MRFDILAVFSLAVAFVQAAPPASPPAQAAPMDKRCSCQDFVGNSYGCGNPTGGVDNYCRFLLGADWPVSCSDSKHAHFNHTPPQIPYGEQ